MTAAVPDPREGIDWSQHRGSCRVFYVERRCTCGAVPDPRFRDQLADVRPIADKFSEALGDHAYSCICRRWAIHHSQVLAVVAGRIIAAEVEARVRAAANQRAAAELRAAADVIEGDGEGGFAVALRRVNSADGLRARADALDPT